VFPLLIIILPRQTSITTCASCNERNQCSLKHSSRNLPLKLSITPFWTGFPSWMRCGLTPCWPAHASNAVPKNSGPLSRITVSGNGRPGSTGSTPLSQTIELRVTAPVSASPVFAAAADCDTVRCNQRCRRSPQRGCGSGVDSPVLV
jgi:hypothetical protein